MLNKKVYEEYERLGFKYTDFTPGDLKTMLSQFIHIGADIREANILLILAIRDAAENGGVTNMAVGKTVETWIVNGIKTADQAKEYVDKKKEEIQEAELPEVPMLTEQQMLEIDWTKY